MFSRFLFRCRDIFLDGYFFFLDPFFLKISSFKAWDLVDIVANSENKCNLFVFWLGFLHFVLGHLSWQALQ